MSTPTVSRTIEIPEVTYRNLETVYGANITKFRSRKAVILAAIEIGVVQGWYGGHWVKNPPSADRHLAVPLLCRSTRLFHDHKSNRYVRGNHFHPGI